MGSITSKAWLVKARNCTIDRNAPTTSTTGTTIEASAYAVHEVAANVYIKLSRYAILLDSGAAQSLDVTANAKWMLYADDDE